uniref:Uncharacterized protein n=1 Tax=Nelumbo nucifera TaxID=4432 RepID=A0A822ZDS2_NELNU|nr:TPA_asm: hypothetical protein HUJ06_015922 [Nelumbo nucifera]
MMASEGEDPGTFYTRMRTSLDRIHRFNQKLDELVFAIVQRG